MYKRRKKKSRFLRLLVLLVLVAGFSYIYWQSLIYAPIERSDSEVVVFEIRSGQSAREVARNLKDVGLIKNETAFYLYVRLENRGSDIFAGKFNLNRSMNTAEILEAITTANSEQVSFTIQEGLMLRDIDQKLASMELIPAGAFLEAIRNFDEWATYPFLDQTTLSQLDLPLEGYIYPDTYFIDPNNFTSDFLISSALDNFAKKFATINLIDAERSVHEIVTMASIVETEVFGFKDRQIVAGILWKRLDNDWAIQADATTLYITDDRIITAADLDIDSPYNTRKFRGLPPGPISNPSVESIQATVTPKSSPYWFYLTTLDTGEVIYSETNEEHNANRYKYL